MSVNIYDKNSERLIPIATDREPESIIDDLNTSTSTVYSSQKTEERISSALSKNAVKIKQITTPTDILAYAASNNCGMLEKTLIRIHSVNATNNPYGVDTDTDFFYEISKIDSITDWISIKAKDVRTNSVFFQTRNGNTWLGWKKIALEV